MLLRQYDRAAEANNALQAALVKATDLKQCMDICASLKGKWKVLQAARGAGFDRVESVDDFAETVAAEANRDIRQGVRYEKSAWRRWHEFMRIVLDKEQVPPAYQQAYNDLLAELERYDRMPPPVPPRSRERYESHFDEGLTGNATRYVLDALAVRSRLYYMARDAAVERIGAVEKALSSGTIEPLRLEFDTASLVYPLYITSLGEGSTDVELYVLGEHRVEATAARAEYGKEFRTAFAGHPDGEELQRAPVLASFVRQGRDYLTELRAEMFASEMAEDVGFRQAADDAPYREQVTTDGRRLGPGAVWLDLETWRAVLVGRRWEVGIIAAAAVLGAIAVGLKRLRRS